MATQKKPAPKPAAKPAPVAAKKPATKAPAVQEARAPGDMDVSVTLEGHDDKTTVRYNFGKDLDDASELFTPKVVYAKWIKGAVLDLQAHLRLQLKMALIGGKDGKKVPVPADPVGDWKPRIGRSGGGMGRKSASEKVQVLVGKLSAEERAALIARLQAGA